MLWMRLLILLVKVCKFLFCDSFVGSWCIVCGDVIMVCFLVFIFKFVLLVLFWFGNGMFEIINDKCICRDRSSYMLYF